MKLCRQTVVRILTWPFENKPNGRRRVIVVGATEFIHYGQVIA